MPARVNPFKRFTQSVSQKLNTFLYGEKYNGYGSGAVYDADAPYEQQEQQPRRRRAQYREEQYDQSTQEAQAWQQGQQPYQQAPQGYQQPWQQAPQYAQQPMMNYAPQQQAPYQPPMTQFAAQVEEQRARSGQEPQQQKVVPFPGAYNGEQPAQEAKPSSVRVITVRGFNDCRSAITYLRDGEILLIVMDGIQDQAEMRRYVDTLSGACFSLSATITKVSRYGTYLAAPTAVNVWADANISQMNGSARRAAPSRTARSASYHAPQADYAAQQPYQPSYADYAPAEEPYAAGNFYARQPQPAPEQPPFEAQERGSGYAPDHEAAL